MTTDRMDQPKRIRSLANQPARSREASERLISVVAAAHALAEAPPPVGRGVGQALIESEIADFHREIQQLTEGTDSLDQQLRSPYRLIVVGPSQAGKSTLINVLAGHRVLATTGGGDAKTLKDTILTYSSEGDRTLRVQYISKQEAHQRRFKLEAYVRNLPKEKESFVKPWPKGRGLADTEKLVDEVLDLSEEADSSEKKLALQTIDRRYATLVTQIKQLIYPELRTEKQKTLSADEWESINLARLADWVDGWCMLLGHETVAGGRFATLWQPRLLEAAKCLNSSVEVRERDIGERAFRSAIERYTASSLAFLVERVELALPSEDLAYMDVEDLPGVGNFKDPAADIARDVLAKAMGERYLDGVLIVTNQNGLDQNTAELLKNSRVLGRVLEGRTDLAVAITHIDKIARQQQQKMLDDGMDEDELPSRDETLRAVSRQAELLQRQRLQELLHNEIKEIDESEQRERVDKVLGRSHFIGVEASAAEVFRLKVNSRVLQPFAESYEGTGVPNLLKHFEERAQIRHNERLSRVLEQTARIEEAITAELVRIARDHDIAESVRLAAASREAYIRALEQLKLPLSNRWTVITRDAQLRLKEGVPAQFPHVSLKAQKDARQRKKRVIQRCEKAGPSGGLIHWATMHAALRWGGTWSGAHHLDLPGDLAAALMPALLSGWAAIEELVKKILSDYSHNATALLNSLEEVAVEAAQRVGLEHHHPVIADARSQIARNTASAMTLFDGSLDSLSEEVQGKFREALKRHFEEKCEEVIYEIPRGPGFTRAALQQYDEIGETAIEAGAELGIGILTTVFNKLRKHIESRLFTSNPISNAYHRLISSVHDKAEASEVVEARAALVAWAKANLSWAPAQPSPEP